MRRLLAPLALLLAGASHAAGPSVTLAGILGAKALLVIDGQTRALGPGESAQGVRMVSLRGASAVVDIDGRRATLQMGGAPALVGNAGPAGGNRIVMIGDSAGHFRPDGSINGRVAQFIVDTGATLVTLDRIEAEKLGVAYRSGQQVATNTANGNSTGWVVRLDTIRIGDVTVYDVDALVTLEAMPFVLLGNSFLTRFQMTRTNDQMVLEKRF